jgi:hypothetical protein
MGGNSKDKAQAGIQAQQQRYEAQQGPMVNAMAYNYGRGSEANYGDYTDIMNQYRGIASGAGTAAEGGGGGGDDGGGGSYDPYLLEYHDPFKSYTGFEEFSNTGGYSKDDIGNMRARGVSPIRAAYANAEREVGRQRSLQGGYSPNAFALQGRMAREQGQSGADATQTVEAGLAEARNKGRLSGLAGMSDIEKQRLAADLDIQKYNANAKTSAQSASNAGRQASADRAAAGTAASRADQFRALDAMRSMYGTTPGMASTFGNQLISAVGQGGNQGANTAQMNTASQALPGAYDTTMNRATGIAELASKYAYPLYETYQDRKKQPAAAGKVPTQPGEI